MICLFSSIKETFYRTAVSILSKGACKARKSVIIDPYTRLPDSNNFYYNAQKLILEILQLIDVVIS